MGTTRTARACILLMGLHACAPAPSAERPSALGPGNPTASTPHAAPPDRPRPIRALDLTRLPGVESTVPSDEQPGWIELELTEVVRPATTPAPTPGDRDAAVPLPPERIRELLDRLPPPGGPAAPGPGADGAPPAARSSSVEPSRSASARVVSVSPSGETELAPYVTVVFSDAMVPLGTDEAGPDDLPVALEPAVTGRWRWLDVRTVRFEPEAGRLPGATAFALRVAPGARTESGAELESGTVHRFRTTGVRVLGGHPHVDTGATGPEPLLFVVLDQDTDPAEAARHAELTADGTAPVPLRRVDRRELEALAASATEEDSEAHRLLGLADDVGSRRWLAFRPATPLPTGAEATLRFATTLPSEEGPLTAGREQRLDFTVRGPLTVTESPCREPDDPCPLAGRLSIRLSNPIAPEVAERLRSLDLSGPGSDSTLLSIRPSVAAVRVSALRDRIRIDADFRPYTTYSIELGPGIEDTFGQSLPPGEAVEVPFGGVEPRVALPGAPFVVLDPALGDTIGVRSIGHGELTLTLHAVEPDDWSDFRSAFDERTGRLSTDPGAWRPSGPPVARWTEPIDGGGLDFTVVPVDLSAALSRGGHTLLLIEGREPAPEEASAPLAAWIQSTSFSLGAAWGEQRLVGWAMELEDEAPATGVGLFLGARSTVTDSTGLASLPLPSSPEPILVGRRGDEVAILPSPSDSWHREGWIRLASNEGAEIFRGQEVLGAPIMFTLTDRGVYQPGEALEGHGWVRSVAGHPPDLTLPTSVDSVHYRLRVGRSSVHEGALPVTPDGTFHLRTTLPEDIETGSALLEWGIRDAADDPVEWRERVGFRIAEFRRPEYEVALEMPPGPYVAGDAAEASVSAAYYDGGPLRGAPVRWRFRAYGTAWSAPGWSGWSFGGREGRATRTDTLLSSRAGADGTHTVRLEPSAPLEPVPVSLSVDVEVEDVNRQAGSARRRVVIHPAAVAPAVRIEQRWLELGEEVVVDGVVVDLDGTPVEGADLDVRVFQESPREEVAVDCAAGEEVPVGEHIVRPLTCRARPARTGRVVVEAIARDGSGRASRTRAPVHVARSDGSGRALRTTSAVDLTPDRTLYRPGDTARIRIDAPVAPLRGLLTVSRAGLRSVRVVEFDDATETVEIPLGPEDVAGLSVAVSLTGRFRGNASLQGSTTLEVDDASRRLTIGVEPARDTVEPGEEVEISVQVRRPDGNPAAGAVVAVWGVDEAVLSLLDGLTSQSALDPLTELLRRSRGRAGGRIQAHRSVVWAPHPPGPGRVIAEVVDGATGRAASGVQVTVDGVEESWTVSGGRLFLTDIPEGEHRLRLVTQQGREHERVIEVGPKGVDLGTLAIFATSTINIQGMSAPGLDGITVAGTTLSAQRREVGSSIALRQTELLGRPPGTDDPVGFRTDFRPLAFFEERVVLDAEGRAAVRVRLPDTMTRYRLRAAASAGATHFGLGEATLTANRPLAVRATPPRILRPGDRPELPVTVHNRSTRPLEIEVVARAMELRMERPDAAGVRVRLAAGERREVRFPAAAERAGTAILDVFAVGTPTGVVVPGGEGAGAGDERTDAVRHPVPVAVPRAPRSVTVHDALEGREPLLSIPIEVPEDAAPGFGTVEVGLSTSRLQPLVDVLAELCVTPLPWPGATAARVFGLSALDPVLGELRGAGLPDATGLQRILEADVQRLGNWLRPFRAFTRRRSDDAWTGADQGFLSPLEAVHAVHALAAAEDAESSRESRTASQYEGWVWTFWNRERERLAEVDTPVSGWESAAAAYALHVAAAFDAALREADRRPDPAPHPDSVAAWLTQLVPADLPVEAVAWLLGPAERYAPESGLAEALVVELENRALTTGATATFRQGERATATGDAPDLKRLVLASSRRADAAALAALLDHDPGHPLVAGLVRGLLGQRGGTWGSGAHENGWVLHALGRYARVHEGAGRALRRGDGASNDGGDARARSQTVRAFLGDRPIGEASLTADDAAAVLEVPLPAAGTRADLRVERVDAPDDSRAAGAAPEPEGAADPLFVRAGIRYSPAVTPETGPVERGFVVSRRYEGVDDPEDVRRLEDGSWRIRPGARVRVRLTITAPARRFQVQLSDPVPGGLEVINPRLRGTGFAFDPVPPPAVDPPRPALSRALASTSRSPLYGWDWTEILFRWRSYFFGWETHRELQDGGMEAYTPFLPAGTYETSYLVRATTPGTFLAPPPRAEETEHPESFGQAGADVIVVR